MMARLSSSKATRSRGFRDCHEWYHYPCRAYRTGHATGAGRLVRLVLDQRDNHAIQIEEKHDKVKAELDE